MLRRLTHSPDSGLEMGLPVLALWSQEVLRVALAMRLLFFPVNCLDRHVHVAPDKVALIWEKDEPGEEVRVTYRSVLTSERTRDALQGA